MHFSLFVFIVLLGGVVAIWWRHQLQLVKHEGVSRAQFVGHFRGIGIAEAVSGPVYDHFEQMSGVNGFQPAPMDSFEETYKMVGEDLDDELEELLQKLGWEMPHSGILREWNGPLETLSDLVRCVDWVRSMQNPSVAVL